MGNEDCDESTGVVEGERVFIGGLFGDDQNRGADCVGTIRDCGCRIGG